MERGRDRDREESGPEHGQGSELVTSPVYRPRQRSPLSPLSQRERVLSPMTGTAERMTAESAVPAVSAASGNTTATTPETTIQSPILSPSPPVPALLSTSPNQGPMLTNQDDVEEKLKRMNETFLRSLEGIGKGGRDKEKEREVERDTATRRGVFLVTSSEGEVPANPSGGGPLMQTSASPYPGGQHESQVSPPPVPVQVPTNLVFSTILKLLIYNS
jgi:autophagy-related protein 13